MAALKRFQQPKAGQLMHHLSGRYRTACRVKHKIMQAMTVRGAWRQLGGTVLLDDAYSGGARSGKAGRGSENKIHFVIAAEVSDHGRPRHAVICPVTGFTLKALVRWAQVRRRTDTEVFSGISKAGDKLAHFVEMMGEIPPRRQRQFLWSFLGGAILPTNLGSFPGNR